MNYKQQLAALSGMGGSLLTLFFLGKSAIYYGKSILEFTHFSYKYLDIVDTGHKGFKFNKVTGLQATVYREGYHLRVPWFEIPIIYNVKSQPQNFTSKAGSKGNYELFVLILTYVL